MNSVKNCLVRQRGMRHKYDWLIFLLSSIFLADAHDNTPMDFCFDASNEGFRLNTTIFMTTNASHWMTCLLDCYKEPCCRSINFKTILTSEDEPKCELLHNLAHNTSKELLQGNASYDYAYFTMPEKEYSESCLIPKECQTSLGIEHRKISDVAMTSSSILDNSSFPHYARLRNQNGNCAWVPAETANRNSSWLQIDMGVLTSVSALATQGSCSGDQWTKSYVVLYSDNSVDWNVYGELATTKVFIGNNDSSSVVTSYFKTPFTARFVRISPRTWNKNAALRIELFTDNCNVSSISAPPHPRSCLDHLKSGLKTNGYYNIYDVNSSLVTVYCDMTSESGKAWTLVTSWATKNKDMAEFQTKPLSTDSPVEENLPNWNKYRMRLSMMNDLSAHSSHWRATCNFPTDDVDYVDYVRGKFADFHVVNFLGEKDCKRVEYINIRGHNCSNCTVPWWQKVDVYFLHTDSSYATCGFNATEGLSFNEDNFGFYADVNEDFRCTADASATTNWWFGGNIA